MYYENFNYNILKTKQIKLVWDILIIKWFSWAIMAFHIN